MAEITRTAWILTEVDKLFRAGYSEPLHPRVPQGEPLHKKASEKNGAK